MPAPSSLSLAALALRHVLAEASGLEEHQVVIGPPHLAAKQQEKTPDKDFLCLFFYRTAYSGYPADGTSDAPLYVGSHCLVTAFGGQRQGDGPTAGEIELRLIGAVLQALHARPMLRIADEARNLSAQLQIVPLSLGLDELNHLWAAQNNTPCHISLAYELALLPIPPASAPAQHPRVVSVVLRSADARDNAPLARALSPHTPAVHVASDQDTWTPHICLLDADEQPVYTLSLAAGTKQVRVVSLGENGSLLDANWEIWEKGERQWRKETRPAALHVKGAVLAANATREDVHPLVDTIGLPFSGPGQLLLHASRTVFSKDASPLTLVSNPVLIALLDGA